MAIRINDSNKFLQNRRENFRNCIKDTINTSEIPRITNRIQEVVKKTEEIQNNFEKGRTLISYRENYRTYHPYNSFYHYHNNDNTIYSFLYIDIENEVGRVQFNPPPQDPRLVTFTDRDIGGQTTNIQVSQDLTVASPRFEFSTSNDFGQYWIASDIEPNLSLFISSSILNNIVFPVIPNTGLPIKFNFRDNKFFLEILGFNLYINVNEDFNSNILYYIINHPYRIYFDKDLKQTQKIPLIEHHF